MQELKRLITAAKALVIQFKLSGLNVRMENTLLQESETRWNSLLMMLESVVVQEDQIKQLLREKDAEHKAENVDFVLRNLICFFATTPNGYKNPGRRQTAYNSPSMFMVSQVVAAHNSIFLKTVSLSVS